MELRQLEYFVAVAEEANFTRAAERVNISQSGVSAQVRTLERELGIALIDRSSRTATLTVAGEAALVHARDALRAADALRQAVSDVTGLIRGRLVVGMVIGCTVTPLFDALAAFHTHHPGVEITLLEDSSDRLVHGVRAGEIDLALVGAAGSSPSGLEAITLISEPLVALVPATHPLAALEGVPLAALAAHPIVCMPPGTGIRAVFDQACAAAGVRSTIALQASAADAIADLAARGLGVAVLSASMGVHYSDRLVSVSITDIETPATLALIWPPQGSPAVRELANECRMAFA